MATPKKQRIGIWIIAIVMVIGTIGSFVVIILANENQKVDQANMEELQTKYQQMVDEYQSKVQAQSDELSKKHYAEFSKYQDVPAEYDKSVVKELEKNDLKVGDGEDVKIGEGFVAYYIGWNPDGKVFDSSIDGDKLKTPIGIDGTIEGWRKGIEGMKVGGVRELTIPSDMAYGEQGASEDIPPNTPLKFVLMIIPTPEKIPQPDLSSLQ